MRKQITLEQSEQKTLASGFQEFMRMNKVKGLSEKTLFTYEKFYTYFSDFLGSDSLCSEVTKYSILDFIEHLQGNNPDIRNTTINTYLRSIRVMLYFFMEQGYTPNFKISLIKAEKKIHETYTDAELERLLKKPNVKKCLFSEYRNWVIICYLLGTGNRLSTVINLKIGDIDFETHEVKLKTVKNKRQYIMPLSSILEKTLIEYLAYRKGNEDEYLFCSSYGGQMTKDGLATCIRKYNHSRGVAKTSFHLFRHTFAKRWILNGGDAFRLKTILGHSTMAMVNEYVNMWGNDLRHNFDTFNPLENMECLRKSNGHIKMSR